MEPCELVWRLAGQPEPAAKSTTRLLQEHPAICAMTGMHCEMTADADHALGSNFSDRSHLRYGGSRIGPAALWCCSGKPPKTLRMWSIVAAPGIDVGESADKAFLHHTPGLCLVNRHDPTPVSRILMNPPDGDWVVSIAVSGQKHVLPFAHTNHGTDHWRIRMEDHDIASTPSRFRIIYDTALALRRLGIPADAVYAGEPRFVKTRDQLDQWSTLNRRLTPYLGAPVLDLALWTITKPIIEGATS